MCVIVVGKCNLLRCDLNLNSGTQVKLLGVKEVEGKGGGSSGSISALDEDSASSCSSASIPKTTSSSIIKISL